MRIRPVVTSCLLASALTLPGSAFALGLGKLTVDSSLGQPLSARIDITSATKDEIDSLTARIADQSLYRQNNLAYHSVLSRARVTLERTASGQAYLSVATQGAVNEPYLDLMVELNWATGRIVREYTFLLDPPGVPTQAVEPVAPLRQGAAPPPAVMPPVASTPPPPRAATIAPAPVAPAPAAAPPPRAAAAQATPRPAPRSAGDDGTYTVKSGDTLSKIAGEVKPPSVTLEQMLVALFKRNQDAFDGNNINRLRAGAIMTIPSAGDAQSVPVAEASQVVRMQAADWRAYRDRVASGAPLSEGTGSRAGGGKIGTVVTETVPAAPPGRDQLQVSRETMAGKGGAAAASESTITRDRTIKEQGDRIAELERTIKDMQRVAELKSQTLAQLQAQAEQAKGGQPPKAATPGTTATSPPTSTTASPPATPTPPPTASTLPATSPEAKAPPAPAAAPPAEPAKAPEPAKAATPPPPPAPEAKPAEPPKAAPKAEPPKPAVSFFDDILANTPTWAIGGAALVVLAGIAAMIAARRRKAPMFEDTTTPDTDMKTNTVFGSTGGGVVNTGDNSLSSEFSREGLGSIDTDEVDPIAEAEVYLAYGRDAQAEEILKDALKKDPQRQEVYLKLLEIHAQHNKPSAFETVAAELYAVSRGQGDVWQKAVALGRQLDPSNAMFADKHAAPATGDTQTFSVPPELTADSPHAAMGASARSTLENYDLKLDADIARGAGAKSAHDILADADAELEHAARATSTTNAAFARTSAAAATAALVDGIARAKPIPEPAVEPVEEKVAARGGLPDLEFRLDDEVPPKPSSPASPTPAPLTGLAGDKLDFSFDDARPTFEDQTPSVIDGQWHDAATKLDLAKAYQEMGDVEGAREILQEVLREGNDEQKTEAQALIAKLG